MATTRKQRRSMAYLMALAVVVYGILSIAIGVATADHCGDYDAPKAWSMAPPGWDCR